MRIVGLDLSLRATGVASDRGTEVIRVPLPPRANEFERTLRLANLSRQIGQRTRGVDLVVIEGPAYMAEFSHAHSLGELAGVVKVCLVQWRVPFVIVSTTALKKYATGKGNAAKDVVFAEAVRMNPAIQSNDEADAWWLRHMAIAHYTRAATNKVRKEVLDHIVWPELAEREVAVG